MLNLADFEIGDVSEAPHEKTLKLKHNGADFKVASVKHGVDMVWTPTSPKVFLEKDPERDDVDAEG